MYGDLVGIEAPSTGLNLEVKPFVTSRVNTDRVVAPPSRMIGWPTQVWTSYAVTQNLALDVTVNTDFAQVEVDEQQVNLTRFNLLFPEKREFFLEGRCIDFGSPGWVPRAGRRRQRRGAHAVLLPADWASGERTRAGARRRTTDGKGRALRRRPVQHPDGRRRSDRRGLNELLRRPRETRPVRPGQRRSAVPESIGVDRGARRVQQAWGVDGAFGFNNEANLLTYYARSHTPRLVGNDQSYRARFNYDADLIGGTADYLVVGNEFNPEIGFVRRRDFRNSALSARFSPRPASIPWLRKMSFQGDVNYFENDRARYVESRDRSGQISLDLENGDAFAVNATDTFEFPPRSERISGALRDRPLCLGGLPGELRVRSATAVAGEPGRAMGRLLPGDRFSLSLGSGRIEVHPQLSIEPSLSSTGSTCHSKRTRAVQPARRADACDVHDDATRVCERARAA